MGCLLYHSACAPLLGVVRGDRSGCSEFNDAAIDAIVRSDIRVVVLAARWDIDALGRTAWELDEGLPQVFIQDNDSRAKSLTENERVFARGLSRTLARLKQARCNVLLLLDVPNTSLDTPTFLARSASRGLISQNSIINIGAYKGAERSVDEVLLRLGHDAHATVVDLKSFLCTGSNCLIAKDGKSLFRDDHHLTAFGALQFVGQLREDFRRSLHF